MNGAAGHTARQLSAAERARLSAQVEERDFLLISLDDLEAEWQHGDISDSDYHELRDGYTRRAASAIREVKKFEAQAEPGNTSESAELGSTSSKRALNRGVAKVGGLVVFAAAIGWLMAQAAGERGANEQLTGEIAASVRQQVLECQNLGGAGQIQESLLCFDDILAVDPQNVEALTYKGWFLVLTAGSAQQAGQSDNAELLIDLANASLQTAVEIDPRYPDARAFRAVVFEREGKADSACQELQTLRELDPPPMMLNLTASVSERLDCGP